MYSCSTHEKIIMNEQSLNCPDCYFRNGKYHIPKFEVNLQIPEGWEYSKNYPEWITSRLIPNDIGNVKGVFKNQKTNGLIMVTAVRDYFQINQIYWKDKIRHIRQSLKMEKTKIKNFQMIKSYNYHVFEPDGVTFMPGLFISPTFLFEKKAKLEINEKSFKVNSFGYIYLSSEKKYHLIEGILVSSEKQYWDNNQIFKNLMKSIKYPPKHPLK